MQKSGILGVLVCLILTAIVLAQDKNTLPLLAKLEADNTIRASGFSKDGKSLFLVGNFKIYIFDAITNQKRAEFKAPFSSRDQHLIVSPDNKTLIVRNADTISIVDLVTQQFISLPEHAAFDHAALSPDGAWLAITALKELFFYDVVNRKLKTRLKYSSVLSDLVFSQNALLNATQDGFLERLSIPKLERLNKADVSLGNNPKLALSSDGTKLASVSSDGLIGLWNAQTCAKIWLNQKNQKFVDLAWAHSGAWFASIDQDFSIRRFDVSGKALGFPIRQNAVGIEISKDDRMLLAVPGNWTIAAVFDANSGVKLGQLEAQKYNFQTIGFNPNNMSLLTSGDTETDARVWDLSKVQFLSSPSVLGTITLSVNITGLPAGHRGFAAVVNNTAGVGRWLETGKLIFFPSGSVSVLASAIQIGTDLYIPKQPRQDFQFVDGANQKMMLEYVRQNLPETRYASLPNITHCTEGSLLEFAKQRALWRINFDRAVVGVSPVVYDTNVDNEVQRASLVMSANNLLSHNLPTSAKCYTLDAATGAKTGNLHAGSSGTETESISLIEGIIDGWANDSNNINEGVGHRRWLLFPQLEKTAFGFVNGYATMKVIYPTARNMPDFQGKFVAYPIGDFPEMLFDKDHFSFSVVGNPNRPSSTDVNLSKAFIRVTNAGGQDMSIVNVSKLNNGAGLPNSLEWKMPDVVLGEKYSVAITGITVFDEPESYSYNFRVLKPVSP